MVNVSKPVWSIGQDGARISFLVPSPEDARKLCDQMTPDKQWQLTIKEYRKKRSLSANALMWAVLGEMAKRLQPSDPGVSADELYRRYIQHSPNYCVIEVPADEYKRLQDTWISNGIGWVALKTDIIDGGEYDVDRYIVRLYYGSSQYDSKQMAQLIDCILQDANAIGIDSTSESFRALMEMYPGGQYG